jgi:hypothetical protein
MGTIILLVIALVLLLLAAVTPLITDKASPVQLGWLGMFFFVLTFIINK